MKAVVFDTYGEPDVLRIEEVSKPIPKDNEVLVQILASTVNRTDCGFRKPEYFIVRLFSGLFSPKIKILGTEFSGIVEAVGSKVSLFKPGDEVFGLSTYKFGTHAEYICIREDKSIALKPVNITHIEAASVCDGLMLGSNFIKTVQWNKPVHILINGASGSIGSACLQLAKHKGAKVTAVGNTNSQDLLKQLGADIVYDYTQTDFTTVDGEYDYIFDTVGKSTFFKCKHLLKPKGVYISSELGPGSQNIFMALLGFFSFGKRVKFPIPTDSKKDILYFKSLIEQGAFKPVIDKIFPLQDIVEATRYVANGQKTGNVVLSMQ